MMAPKRGAVGAASSRSVGKRKSREPCNPDVTTGSGAAGSSNCTSDYLGVRNRRNVEIKRWYEGRLDFCKDVKMSEEEAAMVHDLARLYLDINWERLNIETLVFRMQEEDPALNGFGEVVHIGKEFLISFVEKHPIAQVEGCTPKERVDSMKEAIIALAPEAFKGLKKEIADNRLFHAGCYRKETYEFFPAVEYNEDLKKEIERLESRIASMEFTHAEELKAKDAEGKAKDAQIASLEEDLRTARGLFWLRSPTSGLELLQESLHDDDWIDTFDWSTTTARQQSID